MDAVFSDFEFKFAGDGATGEFSGYASVFGNTDSHGDVIAPGAFTETLAERKAAGRGIPMHVMHGLFGGDSMAVGRWNNVSEDEKGLIAEGKISGMNTDAGRLIYERVKDGALGGISIGYRVKPGGSKLGKKAGEPKRLITNVHLGEISLVDEPSNALARVAEVKAMKAMADHAVDPEAAATSIAAVMKMHDAHMADTAYPSAKDKAVMMNHLMSAHSALTGNAVPDGLTGWKAMEAYRELETALKAKGFTDSQIAQVAECGFKSLLTRTEPSEPAEIKSTIESVDFGFLSNFSLLSV